MKERLSLKLTWSELTQPWRVLPRFEDDHSDFTLEVDQDSHGQQWVLCHGNEEMLDQGVLDGDGVRMRWPVGGPYGLKRLDDRGQVLEHCFPLFVGDLWLMAGQSNMQGVGLLAEAPAPNPMVSSFDMADGWGQAREPVNFQPETCRAAYLPNDPLASSHQWPKDDPRRIKGTGPGLSFAQNLTASTGVPVGLIPCAKGGSPMELWKESAEEPADGEKNLYHASLERVLRCGHLKGMLWSQGCSEAMRETGAEYHGTMMRWFEQFRKDLQQPDLPVIMAQIHGFYGCAMWKDQTASWDLVRATQGQLQSEEHHIYTVSSVDLELDDPIHLSGAAQVTMGQRYAQVAWAIEKGGLALSPQIKGVEVIYPNKVTEVSYVHLLVHFKNIQGGLHCLGHKVRGFELLRHGVVEPWIYRARLLGSDHVVLQTELRSEDLGDLQLRFAGGMCPELDLYDGRGLPVLAWGPEVIAGSFAPTHRP